MGLLEDRITTAETALTKAKSDGDNAAESVAQARLDDLKAVQAGGYEHPDTVGALKGGARKEGRDKGEKDALSLLGFDSIDDAKQSLAAFRQWKEEEQSELDKANEQIDALTNRAETAEGRVSELGKSAAERSRRDAISNALVEANYQGKVSHAIGAVDLSKVKEDDGKFDASEAVKALQDDEFPGFTPDTPDNPERPPTTGPTSPTGKTAGDRFNERLKRRGRPATE